MMPRTPRRPRWWLALAQVFLMLFTFAMPAAAATNTTPISGIQLIQLLQSHQVVRGDETGNLNLDKPIKRSEMITIIVRALGKETEAQMYKGLGIFTDAKGHWAEANIAYAAYKGLVKGDGNNTVRPEEPITYGEALTLILRLAGKEPTSGEWPINILLAAAELGLVPSGVTAGNIGSPAIRGLVFQSLATGLITIKAPSGNTLLAEYLDKVAPTLKVSPVAASTLESTVTVSGTTEGATSVAVNDVSVSVAGNAFSKSVDLAFGLNRIMVKAYDYAGNVETSEVTITRIPKAARIDVSGGSTVGVNGNLDLTVKVYDSAGKEISNVPVTVTISGGGSYSATTGRFTAPATSGTSTLTLKVGDTTKTHTITVLGASAKAKGLQFVTFAPVSSINEVSEVKVRVIDDQGQPVTEDYSRDVTLSSSITSLAITAVTGKTVAGVATFKISSGSAGLGTLTASASGIGSTSTPVTIATPIKVTLLASPNTLVANGGSYTIIRAQLTDLSGALVMNNSGSDIVIQVGRGGVGDGIMSSTLMTIKAGQSSSAGFDITYTVGATPGTLVLTGSMASGHPYSVIGTTLSIAALGSGNPGGGGGGGSIAGPAVRLQVIGVGGSLAPTGTADVVLRVVDPYGTSVLTGNYAFTIKATTSNNEPLVNGLPNGLNVTLGSSGLKPIADPTYGVTGVTVNGIARLRVTYNKSGIVKLEPQVAQTTTTGRDDNGGLIASATSTVGFTVAAGEVSYTSGSATVIGLQAAFNNNNWLNYNSATNAPAPVNSAVTLTATLRDASGGAVPNASAGTVELFRNAEVTPIATKSISNGSVDFVVTTPATAGVVTYKVRTNLGAGNIESTPPVQVHVESIPLAAPTIVGVRGATDTTPGLPNTIKVGDQYLQFLVSASPTPGQYGVIKVFRVAGGTPIYTTSVLNLSSGIMVVNVPKGLLTNQDQYRLTFDNGAGNSGASSTTATVTIQSKTTVAITSASYDAVSHNLTLTTNYYGATGTVDATKLTLTSPTGTPFHPTIGSANGTGTFVINLSSDSTIGTLENTSVFNGDVRLTAADGWLTLTNGVVAEAVVSGIGVGPFATVTRAFLDTTTRTLTIDTVGTASGYFDFNKISLGATTLSAATNTITAAPGRPGRYVISLSPTQATALTSFTGSVTFATGWFYSTGYPYQYVAGVSTPTYAPIEVTSATLGGGVLTVYGSGFAGLTPGNLQLNQITLTNEATSDSYSLADTTVTGITIVNNSTIKITLGTNDAGTGLTTARFNGNLVFLTTTAGWLTDNGGRQAPAVLAHQCGVGFTQ